MTHTKGPWKAIGLSIHTDRKEQKVGTWVANVKQGRADEVEIADAHLIAAAPEMLEALIFLADCFEHGCTSSGGEIGINKSRAAIAKAKGQQAAREGVS